MEAPFEMLHEFQFLIGSLEASKNCSSERGSEVSIPQVVWKLAELHIEEFNTEKFQFLIGSLEASIISKSCMVLSAFQFLIGSLKPLTSSAFPFFFTDVSIPHR